MKSFLTRLWVKHFAKTRISELIEGGEIHGQNLKYCTLVDVDIFDCLFDSCTMIRCTVHSSDYYDCALMKCYYTLDQEPIAWA